MPENERADPRLDATVVTVAMLVLTHALLSSVLALLLPPDPGAISAALARDYAPFGSAVRPEPTERLIFLVNLALLPMVAPLAAWHLRAGGGRIAAQAATVVAWSALALAAASLGNAAGTRRMFRLEEPVSLLLIVLAAGITVLLWRRMRRINDRAPGQRRVAMGVLILLAALALVWRPLAEGGLRASFRHYANLDAVLAPVVQAVGGKVPLADYQSQYGLYAALVAPVFKLVPLGVAPFTLLLTALQLVALGAVLAVIVREVRSPLLATAGGIALVFMTGGYVPARFDPDPYFQYWPIRFLWPALVLLLVRQWLVTRRRHTLLATSFAAGIAITWNLDSGIAAAGAWLGMLGMRAVLAAFVGNPWKPTLRELVLACAGVLLPLVVFGLWLGVRNGSLPDPAALFEAPRRFYTVGFFMLPLPMALHPWHLVAATYVGAMLIGTLHSMGTLTDRRGALLHFLAFLGSGLFPYYQGRSADQVLAAACWPAVVIVFIAAGWLHDLRASGRLRTPYASAFAAAALGFGCYCGAIMVTDAPRVLRLTASHWSRDSTAVTRNIAFLRAHGVAGREEVVIARFQAVYAAQAVFVSRLSGHPVAESVSLSLGERHVHQIRLERPERVFLGEPYLEASAQNPYRSLLELLGHEYELTARTGGSEELRLYRRRP